MISKINKLILLVIVGGALLSFTPLAAFAQNANNNSNGNQNSVPPPGSSLPANYQSILGEGIRNPVDTQSTPGFLLKIMQRVLLVIAVIAVAMVLYAGFMILISQGNETRLKQGKQALLWSILGFAVVLLAFSIIAIIQSVLRI